MNRAWLQFRVAGPVVRLEDNEVISIRKGEALHQSAAKADCQYSFWLYCWPGC